MSSEILTYVLPNGLRGIHIPAKSPVVHTAVMVKAGARDEPEESEGLAHFIEHTLFKGTRRRSMLQVLNCLDTYGGEINAYTTKEETCLYASTPLKYFRLSADLLSDIVLHATFPEKELEKEKEVVIEEIQMYLDSPSEQIFDDFESAVFSGHELGCNILGTVSSLHRMKRRQLQQFIRKHYHAPAMVLCTSGDLTLTQVKQTALDFFAALPSDTPVLSRKKPSRYRVSDKTVKRDTHQAHCMMGVPAYGAGHRKRTTLALLTNLLGGPAMNSRLHLSIREKNGLAYSVEAGYSVYSDSGLFTIYTGTDKQNISRCSEIIGRELKKLRDQPLGATALHAAKRQLKGQLALSRENRLNVLLSAGKSMLVHNRIFSLEEIFGQIDAVSAAGMQETANEIFDPKHLSQLVYLPE
ncbi:MAG: peptidase M16 domain-containing protein [Bacteroidetes bacterium]|nr:MAG: peptidase M16 domain-containing protein [Bacteroidota bacterium]